MLKLKIHSINNASPEEIEKYKSSAQAMVNELNGDLFWKLVSEKWDTMTQKNGYSFTEYYNLIMSGKNKYEKDVDEEIDLYVEYYYRWGKVVGYTRPSTVKTWFNRKFGNIDIASFAGHIYHEHCGHNYGFGHVGGDINSLVYQTGYLMRDAVNASLGKDNVTKYKRSFFGMIVRIIKRLF